jgi:signal transduction histidine kinase
MSLEPSHSDEMRNRWSYLRVIYGLCGFNTFFYIFRFNFEYHVSTYNWILVPLWLLLMAFPAYFLVKFKSYRFIASWVCGFTMLLTDVLIYLAGGLDAPGLLWLAMYPLVLSMLLGPRGAYLGYFVVLSTMTGFTYLNINGLGPNLIEQYGIPKLEKILNLVGFMVFASVTAHFYYHREKDVKANLVQKNNDVENLLRVLLHDIANTLSRMTYDLVRHKEGDGEPLEIDKIEKAMEDINTLLFQVRHLKSIKDGKSVLPMKGISLTMVLHEVYEIIESQAQQKGIKIAMDMAREKMWVQGDRTILSNVILLNLLTNAIKFSHPGAHIDVRAYLKDKNVVVEVQDYGIGIPPDILRDIFSLNVVTTRPGTHGESGTGYGMPLVKEYLQLMGGQIEVSSQEQEIATFKRGTLVTLLIPIARA